MQGAGGVGGAGVHLWSPPAVHRLVPRLPRAPQPVPPVSGVQAKKELLWGRCTAHRTESVVPPLRPLCPGAAQCPAASLPDSPASASDDVGRCCQCVGDLAGGAIQLCSAGMAPPPNPPLPLPSPRPSLPPLALVWSQLPGSAPYTWQSHPTAAAIAQRLTTAWDTQNEEVLFREAISLYTTDSFLCRVIDVATRARETTSLGPFIKLLHCALCSFPLSQRHSGWAYQCPPMAEADTALFTARPDGAAVGCFTFDGFVSVTTSAQVELEQLTPRQHGVLLVRQGFAGARPLVRPQPHPPNVHINTLRLRLWKGAERYTRTCIWGSGYELGF